MKQDAGFQPTDSTLISKKHVDVISGEKHLTLKHSLTHSDYTIDYALDYMTLTAAIALQPLTSIFLYRIIHKHKSFSIQFNRNF